MSERYKSKFTFYRPDTGMVELTCHFKFEQATQAQKFDPQLGGGKPICNGCGPSGYGQLIPDNILGVNVTPCGDGHNWTYQFGKDREDKMVADETFYDNMDRIIRAAYEVSYKEEAELHDNNVRKIAGGSLVAVRTWLENRRNFAAKEKIKALYMARLVLAKQAYERAVVVFGGSAFWDKRKINFTLDDVHT